MSAVPSIGRAAFVERSARAPQAATTEGLYERHAAKILSYCHHQLGSREEAEDAVQTTFMNAFRALGRGVVPESESAWLFKIAENVCLSRRRSSWRRGRIESPSDFDVIEEIVPGPSRQRDELIGIEDALAGMPEQQRRAILLREWQGLSYREIADELEVSQSAVETLIFRARRSLAQGLEQPELQKKPKRKGFRRALHIVDFGTLVAAAKTLLAGSAAVKATAAAVAVTAAAGTAAGVKNEGHSPMSAPAPAAVVAAPKPAAEKPAAAASSAVAGVAPASVAAIAPAEKLHAAPAAPRPAEARKAAPPVSRVAPTAKPTATATKTVATAAPPPVATEPVAPASPPPADPAVPAPAPMAPPEPAQPPAVQPSPPPAAQAPDEQRVKERTSREERREEKRELRRGRRGGQAPAEPRHAPEPKPAAVVAVTPVPAPPAPDATSDEGHEQPQDRRGRRTRELASLPVVQPDAAADEVTATVDAAPGEQAAAAEAEPAEDDEHRGKRRGRRG